MRIRIKSVTLGGTSRRIDFKPGLNIITGPIASGKTTLLRFCRALLGASIDNLPREAREAVGSVLGEIFLGAKEFSIIRPAVTTTTAKVDIAGNEEAERLPFSHSDDSARTTYVQWLLYKLNLPYLEVPSSPTKPESEPTPVTINDYLLYCTLRQDEIGFSVFGHKDSYKNIKRKYVFEIIYGLYSVEAAKLQEELRDIQSNLRELLSQDTLFSKFLDDTALANRAEIERRLEQTKADLAAIESDSIQLTDRSYASPLADLQTKALKVSSELQNLHSELDAESQAVKNLERLSNQLENQIGKITRSIVAQKHLLDIDFVVCPRCGATVHQSRGEESRCYLCLQHPEQQFSRETLIDEQARIEAQLIETRELIAAKNERRSQIEKKRTALTKEAALVHSELDFKAKTFVSTKAAEIVSLAEQRASIKAIIDQLTEYLRIHQKLDAARKWAAELERRKSEIEASLQITDSQKADAEDRITFLEQQYNAILERFQPPKFGEEAISGIDRKTYLPVYHGRKFDDLSSPGLSTLVNVAHALAHQKTSIALGLKLPNILFIDGLSEHFGEEGLDPARARAVYEYLIETSNELGENLQIIIVDNEIPEIAREYIRIELSETDRLIPQHPGT